MNLDIQHWKMLVYGMLRAGLGVQDISVKLRALGHSPWAESAIRQHIRELRAAGMLLSVLDLERNGNGKVRAIPSGEDHQPDRPPAEGDQG